MLTTEFNDEMGALLRSLSQRVRMEPTLQHGGKLDALDDIERAIIQLVALHIKLRRRE